MALWTGIPLAITLLGYASEGEPDVNGLWARWQQERIDILQRAGADHRLLNLEVSYEISLKGPRMTVEGLRLLRALGCLPDGAAQSDAGGGASSARLMSTAVIPAPTRLSMPIPPIPTLCPPPATIPATICGILWLTAILGVSRHAVNTWFAEADKKHPKKKPTAEQALALEEFLKNQQRKRK